jgi:photosynthetic reaction center cytochrome c subunit
MNSIQRILSITALIGSTLFLTACERPPVDSVQNGFRGTGMAMVYNPRTLEAQAEKNQVPVSIPADADALKPVPSIRMSKS